VDTEKEMTDAETRELDEALRSINAQFGVLIMSLEKKISTVAFWWGSFGCFLVIFQPNMSAFDFFFFLG